MAESRIVYQDWIVELGRDPKTEHLDFPQAFSLEDILKNGFDLAQNEIDEHRLEELKNEVKKAIDSLSEEEKEFIIRYHYMGKTLKEISEMTNREICKLVCYNKKILRKLKKRLSKFVFKRFGVKPEENDCLICCSKFRAEIDNLIKNRDKRKTWRPIITILKTRYKIEIKTVQTLLGHEKYHI